MSATGRQRRQCRHDNIDFIQRRDCTQCFGTCQYFNIRRVIL